LVAGSSHHQRAGAEVLAGGQRAGAWRAADAGKAALVQRVVRYAVGMDVGPHLGLAPGGERVELLDAVGGVELALGQVAPGHRLLAAQSR
jgi:hypothetical protein